MLLALFADPTAAAAAPDRAFIGDHCANCHNETDKRGRLDLTGLAFAPNDPANLAVWVKVHDRVTAGEMPPRNRPRPDTARQQAFVAELARAIVAAERAALAGEGRAVLRRLNRYEYENALRDLLGVPWVQIAHRLPEDGEAYRFNKSGEALDVSYLTMARFMDSANHALRQAMATGLERPANATRKLYARDEPSLRNWWPRENGTLPDRLAFPVLDGHAQPIVRAGRAPPSSPATREREAVGKVASIFSDAGGYGWNGWRAPAAARYKLRIAGYTIWVAGGGVARWFYEGQGAAKAPVFHTLLWHRPSLDEVFPGRRNEPIAVYAAGGGQTRPIGAVDFTPTPAVREIEAFLLPGEVIRTDGARLFRTRVNGTDEQYVNPLATPDGMPGYAVQWLEIEGPFFDDPAGGAAYRRLFDQLPLKPSEPAPAAASPAAAVQSAKRPTRPNPKPRGRTPSGCCGRSSQRHIAGPSRRPTCGGSWRFTTSSSGRAMASRGRCSRRTPPCWRRRGLCSSRSGRADWTITRWRPGWPCSYGTRSRTRRCGPWPTAASWASRPCYGPRRSGYSATRRPGGSWRRSPTTGSTCGRSMTRRRPPRCTTITNSTTRSSWRRWRKRGCSSPSCCAPTCRPGTSSPRTSRS
jgi:hypothetical protein